MLCAPFPSFLILPKTNKFTNTVARVNRTSMITINDTTALYIPEMYQYSTLFCLQGSDPVVFYQTFGYIVRYEVNTGTFAKLGPFSADLYVTTRAFVYSNSNIFFDITNGTAITVQLEYPWINYLANVLYYGPRNMLIRKSDNALYEFDPETLESYFISDQTPESNQYLYLNLPTVDYLVLNTTTSYAPHPLSFNYILILSFPLNKL